MWHTVEGCGEMVCPVLNSIHPPTCIIAKVQGDISKWEEGDVYGKWGLEHYKVKKHFRNINPDTTYSYYLTLGVQTVAPSSIIAWLKSPGLSGSTR